MSTAFSNRHIGCTPSQRTEMLAALGLPDERALIADVLPEVIREDEPLALPPALSEVELEARLRELAAKNSVLTSMIGMGYHGTITPPVIRRNVLESPAWYTAYTPYQPEISQGRLEALLNFQTLVEDLSGLPTANASLLDEATAAAEAMALARRVDRSGANAFLIDAELHPQVRAVLHTRAEASGVQLLDAELTGNWPEEPIFGVLLQTPGTTGRLVDVADVAERAHQRGALCVVSADPLAMVLLQSPGSAGADIVIGSMQRFGVPMGFGGPHAAFMAVRSGLERQLPGRLVGVSVDADGRGAYRLALQTREQHIRRDKATSNICTAQVLLAIVSAMYAVYHGADGLRSIALHAAGAASRLAAALRAGGLSLRYEQFFDTVLVNVPGAARTVVDAARERGVNLRLLDEDSVGVSTDETTTDEHLRVVCAAFGVPDSLPDANQLSPALPEEMLRSGPLLTHPVFSAYRTETEMLRYLRRLSDRDLALDRTMIPLGSCTMKLNATAEMEPISWPQFADLHPYAPAEQAAGTLELIEEVEHMLAEVTGYAAVSVQPNAGSQGEFAGLLAIRAYHRDRGEPQREICLIPSSAHGTNAASAVMAGMAVSVVACDEAGDVDVADLKDKIGAAGDRLAALMITYPSTHGVFEEHIAEICAMVHDAGGQVYVDGANLNALVGLARPGRFGADVSHLNLHKTFCIPHGGGGPGVGPVAVADHLVAYLPAHPLAANGGVGPVSAAPFGSALVLPISWAYLRLMGPQGLRDATVSAILSANYIANRLNPHFPVLYSGHDGLVAHECIVDLREITKETGITVEDVAKRLIDYGFHAPTMAFPVAGTLMIEPTESESLAELDRFCDAMIAIRAEITKIAEGAFDRDDNPLKRAPHPAAAVVGWDRQYPLELGVFPAGSQDKYFPPVSRIDSAYGDRNLVCSCPPVEAFASSR